jgi:hypothetical protein
VKWIPSKGDSRGGQQAAAHLLRYWLEVRNPYFQKFTNRFSMNTTGKIQNKGQVTIPTAVRRRTRRGARSWELGILHVSCPDTGFDTFLLRSWVM